MSRWDRDNVEVAAGIRVRRLQSKFRPINCHRQRRTIHDARALETINQHHFTDVPTLKEKANFNAKAGGDHRVTRNFLSSKGIVAMVKSPREVRVQNSK